MAVTRRISTFTVRVLPSRSNSRSCRTRSSLGCNSERDVADLVQKQRALVGQFEPPDLLADGAGERAPLMAEQFALDQACRDGGAVHLHKCALAPPAQIVDGARDQLLAGAAFTLNQHGRIGRRHGLHVAQHALQRLAVAYDLLEIVPVRISSSRYSFSSSQLVFELFNLAKGQRILHRDGQFVADLRKQFDVLWREGRFAHAGDIQGAQRLVAAQQRNAYRRLQARGYQAAYDLGGVVLGIRAIP